MKKIIINISIFIAGFICAYVYQEYWKQRIDADHGVWLMRSSAINHSELLRIYSHHCDIDEFKKHKPLAWATIKAYESRVQTVRAIPFVSAPDYFKEHKLSLEGLKKTHSKHIENFKACDNI